MHWPYTMTIVSYCQVLPMDCHWQQILTAAVAVVVGELVWEIWAVQVLNIPQITLPILQSPQHILYTKTPALVGILVVAVAAAAVNFILPPYPQI